MDEIWGPLAVSIEGLHRRLGRPCFVGLAGPQGSGKSTGAARLQALLGGRGLNTAAVSLDDFYLTRPERRRLAQAVHPLLLTRGPPGTHDLALGMDTTRRLLAGESLPLPSFAKQFDDRADAADWPWFEGPADIVLLEGWCVGARPEPAEDLAEPVNDLERDEDAEGVWRRYVNSALAGYQSWFGALDYLILLRPPDFGIVAKWRLQQEEKLRERLTVEQAADLMSAEGIRRFVQHYQRITANFLAHGAGWADAVVDLGPDRRLLAFRPGGKGERLPHPRGRGT